jgi:hypothetical protein
VRYEGREERGKKMKRVRKGKGRRKEGRRARVGK